VRCAGRQRGTDGSLTTKVWPSKITVGISGIQVGKDNMTPDPATMEQAVSRALRANLDGLQRQSEELRQAVTDLAAACSSSRPSNALPPMVRAQASAASLAAVLDVLSRLVTSAVQPVRRSPAEEEVLRVVSVPAPEASPVATRPEDETPQPMGSAEPAVAERAIDEPPVTEPVRETFTQPYVPEAVAETRAEEPADKPAPAYEAPPADEPHPETAVSQMEESVSMEAGSQLQPPEPPAMEWHETVAEVNEGRRERAHAETESYARHEESVPAFDLGALSHERQEMHRRANRVAKVSMQDIKMLKPEQLRLGRENKDICIRLRDEIEKARREYERRFQPILGQGEDYFHHWMVEVLAAGDSDALGNYPYTAPALRH
jgi:hypothetical protein